MDLDVAIDLEWPALRASSVAIVSNPLYGRVSAPESVNTKSELAFHGHRFVVGDRLKKIRSAPGEILFPAG